MIARLLPFALAVFGLLGPLVSPAVGRNPEIIELDCPAGIEYRIMRDLDGDGMQEIVLVTVKGAWIWRGRKSPTPRTPDLHIEFPQGTALFDIAQNGILARTAEAYWQLGLDGTRTRLPNRSGRGLPRRPTGIVWRGILFDFDGDGKQELLDASLDGYRIDFADGSVLLPAALRETVTARAQPGSERRIARYAIGSWERGDFDGDKRADFAVVTDEGLTVYPGDENGRYDAARVVKIAVPEAKESDVSFADWNGDGRTDGLAVLRSKGQATLLLSTAGGLGKARRVRLAVPGYMRFPQTGDLNADGRTDLALPYTDHLRNQNIWRIALHRTVILQVPIFLNRGGDRPLPRLADRKLKIPMKIRIRADAAGRLGLSGLVVAEYGGDLTGDGRVDLLVTQTPEVLAVHPGVADARVFAPEPAFTIAIPDSVEYDSVKPLAGRVNGDAVSDIILHYRGRGLRPDRLFLLLSRKS